MTANPPVRWKRVPGGKSCSWCKTIAGQLYLTSASADFGHDRCDCVAVPVYVGKSGRARDAVEVRSPEPPKTVESQAKPYTSALAELNDAPSFARISDARAWKKDFLQRHGDDPEIKKLQRAMSSWSGNGYGSIRREAASALKRGEHPKGAAGTLIDAVAEAPPMPTVYRGTTMNYPASNLADMFRRGTTHDIPLSSFTRDKATGASFASGEGTPVRFAVKPGAKGVNIEPFSPDVMRLEEREFISGGRFKVISVKTTKTGVDVELEQVAVFGA